MGNQNERMARPRGATSGGGGSQGHRPRTFSETGADDACPLQVHFAQKSDSLPVPDGSHGSTPSFQYEENDGIFPVVIKWTGPNHTKNVQLVGDWDNWKGKIPLVKSTEDFSTILNLPEGRHEMRFVVDGKWQCDASKPMTDNGMGGQNNVLTIDRSEFEVFEALDRDLAMSGCKDPVKRAEGGNHETPNERDLEKLKSFTQDIPDKRDFERATHPPVLPPHLLQVMLNKDTPVQCDPNVLPEPNHVMLNHLYALSIKDGVMVLSATHRYRKKYVTTLLYKPI